MNKKIPPHLQGIFWSVNINDLDLQRDKVYTIHQVLMYGSLADIHWLFKIYSPATIKEVFVTYPKKIYTKPIFYFIKNFILELKSKRLKEEDYVRSSP